jgi:hypothetical protein
MSAALKFPQQLMGCLDAGSRTVAFKVNQRQQRPTQGERGADRLSQGLCIADEVEEVVMDLKCDPKMKTICPHRLDFMDIASAHDDRKGRGRGELGGVLPRTIAR